MQHEWGPPQPLDATASSQRAFRRSGAIFDLGRHVLGMAEHEAVFDRFHPPQRDVARLGVLCHDGVSPK